MITVLCYPKCTTCKRAIEWLNKNKTEYSVRDIKNDNPSLEEIEKWHKLSNLPLKKFFNTSGLVYKSLALKDKLPAMTQIEQYKLLSSNGMLIKRPIIVSDNFVLVGFNEKEWQSKF